MLRNQQDLYEKLEVTLYQVPSDVTLCSCSPVVSTKKCVNSHQQMSNQFLLFSTDYLTEVASQFVIDLHLIFIIVPSRVNIYT